MAAETVILPPIGSCVIVYYGDMFDKNGARILVSKLEIWSGEFIDSDPSKNTVFFEGQVLKYVVNNEFQYYFLN